MGAEKMDALLSLLNELLDSKNVIEHIEDVSPEEAQKYIDGFTQIYDGRFRHSYSQISLLLEKCSPEVYNSLEFWILALSKYAEENEAQEAVRKGLAKLLDHIELEGMRLNRMKAVERYRDESNQIKNDLDAVAAVIEKKAKEAEDSVTHFHEQSIAILSIFSAVVLAFMGGISFASSVLGNISQVSMFRLLITILLLGFVLFNSIFILMRFVAHIIRKNDSKRFKNGILIFNIALALIAAIIIAAYAKGYGWHIEQWGEKPQADSSTSVNSSASVVETQE